MKGMKRRFIDDKIENAIIPPIYRSAGVSHSLSLSLFIYLFIYLLIFKKHVYVQVVVIMAHIFPWFYIQERNALYGSGIGFPSSFLKNWQTGSFIVRFLRLCQACSL